MRNSANKWPWGTDQAGFPGLFLSYDITFLTKRALIRTDKTTNSLQVMNAWQTEGKGEDSAPVTIWEATSASPSIVHRPPPPWFFLEQKVEGRGEACSRKPEFQKGGISSAPKPFLKYLVVLCDCSSGKGTFWEVKPQEPKWPIACWTQVFLEWNVLWERLVILHLSLFY